MKIVMIDRFVCVGLMVLFGIFFSSQAQAQKILEEFNKPLPVVEPIDPAKFQEETVEYNVMPLEDEVLSYSVRLPKTWAEFGGGGIKNYSLNNNLLGEIARYDGPPGIGPRSRFTVQALDLEYQLSAEQWFLQYILTNGYNLQGMKVHSDKKVEGLLVIVEKDISYIVRTVAQINGKRMILAQYFISDQKWYEENVMQGAAVSSFKLTHLKDEIIEEMLQFQFLDIAEFDYPVSWELRAPPLRSIDRMAVKLLMLAAKGSLNGRIEVNLASAFVVESLPDEIKGLKKSFEDKGLAFGKLIEKKTGYQFNDDVEFAAVEAYEVKGTASKLVDYEVWFTIMYSGDYYYFITLLTPSRDADFFVWSRNSETYRLIVESIEPQPETLLEE